MLPVGDAHPTGLSFLAP